MTGTERFLVEIAEGAADVLDRAAEIGLPPNRFLARSWFAAAEAGRAHGFWVASAHRTDRSVAAALPITRGPWGIRTLVGNYWPFRSFPVDPSHADAAVLAILLDRSVRRRLGWAWRVGPLYRDDPASTALESAAPRADWFAFRRRVATGFVLDMVALRRGGSWPRSSTLHRNRHHEKHLAAYGELRWVFVSGDAWTAEVFNDLAAIERSSWVGTRTNGSGAKFIDPAQRSFWERLACDPGQALRLRAALLYIGGQPAAFSFDLDVGTRKYVIANSYDARFARHSPGKCLAYRNLVESLGRGIETVDWGGGDSGYKQTIGSADATELVDYLLVRANILTRPLSRLLEKLWSRSGTPACGGND